MRPTFIYGFVIAILPCFLLSDEAQTQPCLEYQDLHGVIPYEQCPGPIEALASGGEFVFAACGEGGLWVIDAGDSARPTAVSLLSLPGQALDIIVADGKAYLACGSSGLMVVDILEPGSPELIGSLNVGQTVRGLEFVGDRIYLFGASYSCNGGSYLHVIDVADPALPVLVETFEFGTAIMDLAIDGDIAYSALTHYYEEYMGPDWYECDSVSGVGVIDVTSIDSPSELASLDPIREGANRCVEIVDGYLYVDGGGWGLEIYSLANPSGPTQVATVDFDHTVNGMIHAMEKVGNLLYLITYDGWIEVLDTSNPASPTVVSEFQSLARAYDIEFVDRHIYLACRDKGLVSVLVENPAEPAFPSATELALSSLPSGGSGAVVVSGNYAFTCDTVFRVIDLSDPISPQIIADIPTVFESCRTMVMEGDRVYVDGNSTPENDVAVFDISDPHHPFLISYLNSFTSTHKPMAVENGILYRGGISGCVAVYDMTNPFSPVRLNDIEPGYMVFGIDVQDGILYSAGRETSNFNHYRLFVVDVSDPSSPLELGRIPVPLGYEIVADEDRVYIRHDGGFCVVDVTNPLSPFLLSETRSFGSCKLFGRSGDLAYGTKSGSLKLFDLSDESAPVQVGCLPMSISNVALTPDYLVSVGSDGLLVLPLDCQDPVDVFLADFEIDFNGEGARINWTLSENTPIQDLRLTANTAGCIRTISIQCSSPGIYTGLDPNAELQDTTIYTLYLWSGNQWLELSSQTVTGSVVPSATRYLSAYPNPFNPRVSVAFELKNDELVRLSVHDAQGRLIAVLADRPFESGRNEVYWDGNDQAGRTVSSGNYFVRMEVETVSTVCKVTLIR